MAKGTDYGSYTQWSFDGNSTVMALGVVNNSISLAAGTKYDILDRIQCDLSFVLNKFNITVNLVDLTIDVKPDGTIEQPLDPSYHLRDEIAIQLQAITQLDTTLYESALGDSFLTNIVSVGYYDYDHYQYKADKTLQAIQ